MLRVFVLILVSTPKPLTTTASCHKGLEDIEVIRRFLENQANLCFSLLYQRYAGKVYSKCISLLNDEGLAQDATQEIFTKIFLNLAKFGEKSKFSTWLYSITYNYCIDFLRRRKKQKDLFTDEIENAPDTPEEEVPDEALLAMEVKQLKTVLDNLPLGDKAVLLMKYQDGMSIKQIAEILTKTESAVKMKLKRAKAKAQKIRSEMFAET